VGARRGARLQHQLDLGGDAGVGRAAQPARVVLQRADGRACQRTCRGSKRGLSCMPSVPRARVQQRAAAQACVRACMQRLVLQPGSDAREPGGRPCRGAGAATVASGGGGSLLNTPAPYICPGVSSSRRTDRVGRGGRGGRVRGLGQAPALRQAAEQPVLAHGVLAAARGRRGRAHARRADHDVRHAAVLGVLRAARPRRQGSGRCGFGGPCAPPADRRCMLRVYRPPCAAPGATMCRRGYGNSREHACGKRCSGPVRLRRGAGLQDLRTARVSLPPAAATGLAAQVLLPRGVATAFSNGVASGGQRAARLCHRGARCLQLWAPHLQPLRKHIKAALHEEHLQSARASLGRWHRGTASAASARRAQVLCSAHRDAAQVALHVCAVGRAAGRGGRGRAGALPLLGRRLRMAARHAAYFVRLGFVWRRCATFTPGYPCTPACRKRTALQALAGGRIVTELRGSQSPPVRARFACRALEGPREPR